MGFPSPSLWTRPTLRLPPTSYPRFESLAHGTDEGFEGLWTGVQVGIGGERSLVSRNDPLRYTRPSAPRPLRSVLSLPSPSRPPPHSVSEGTPLGPRVLRDRSRDPCRTSGPSTLTRLPWAHPSKLALTVDKDPGTVRPSRHDPRLWTTSVRPERHTHPDTRPTPSTPIPGPLPHRHTLCLYLFRHSTPNFGVSTYLSLTVDGR